MLEKILKVFYGEIAGVFTINELAKKTGVSYSYVYGQIEAMQKRGVIVVEQRSRRKYCKPDYNDPEVRTAFVKISNEVLKGYLKKGEKVSFVIQKLLSVLPGKTDFNLFSVILFGSYARGTDHKKSDLDLFIIVPSKEKYGEAVEMECVALSKGFGMEINPVIAEPGSLISMLRDKVNNVGKEVLKNRIVLFGAEKFWELVFEGLS